LAQTAIRGGFGRGHFAFRKKCDYLRLRGTNVPELGEIAEWNRAQVFEYAQIRDSLLIRRSLVRAQVGEPNNQYVALFSAILQLRDMAQT